MAPLISFVLLISLLLLSIHGQEDEPVFSGAEPSNYLADEDQDIDDIPVVEGFGGEVKFPMEDGVHILDADNYDLFVHSRPTVLVQFYTPWCRHCQELEKEYVKAARLLKDNKPPVRLAKIDAGKNEALAIKHDVKGFPTMFVYINGIKLDYEGSRSAAGMVEYMQLRANPYWRPPPETVIPLTKDTFKDIVHKQEIMLVEFYTPDCEHCKKMVQEYDRAARRLIEESPPILLGKVDCSVEKELEADHNITGYPTLFVFRKNKGYKHHGPRVEKEIVTFMLEQAKPAARILESASLLKKRMSEEAPTILGLFSSKNDPIYETFLDAANLEREEKYKLLYSFSPQLRKDLQADVHTLMLIQPKRFQSEYEPSSKTLKLDKKTEAMDIVYFIGNNSLPLVGLRNGPNMWKFEDKYPIVVVYYDVDFSLDMESETQLVRKQVLNVANKYKDKFTFAISDEKEFEFELKHLGLEESGNDVNVGLFTSEKVRFALEPDDDFTAERMTEFIENVLNGKVQSKHRSLPIPTKKMDGYVHIVVGDTFNEMVLDNPNDVVIEFYAPWCGHCTALEPVYREVAERFQNIVVAKFDATVNDYPPPFKIDGFPNIFFLSNKDKMNPVKYQSTNRTVESISNFINEQLGLLSIDSDVKSKKSAVENPDKIGDEQPDNPEEIVDHLPNKEEL